MTFSCQQIRDFVKAKGHYLMAGCCADHPAVVEINKERDRYLSGVGLSAYVSQMLGHLATTPLHRCILGFEDGRVIEGSLYRASWREVQHVIKEEFSHDLPYVVEIALENGEIQERFL